MKEVMKERPVAAADSPLPPPRATKMASLPGGGGLVQLSVIKTSTREEGKMGHGRLSFCLIVLKIPFRELASMTRLVCVGVRREWLCLI